MIREFMAAAKAKLSRTFEDKTPEMKALEQCAKQAASQGESFLSYAQDAGEVLLERMPKTARAKFAKELLASEEHYSAAISTLVQDRPQDITPEAFLTRLGNVVDARKDLHALIDSRAVIEGKQLQLGSPAWKAYMAEMEFVASPSHFKDWQIRATNAVDTAANNLYKLQRPESSPGGPFLLADFNR